jgi:hypothetical protein
VIATWNAPLPGGATSEELLMQCDSGRAQRVLILPAWFDEANNLRRFTVEVMRRLDAAGIDSFLPDLPGCNESLVPLAAQSLESWRGAAAAAGEAFGASHVLAIRAGALIAPQGLPGWRYEPQSGAKLLRGMIRARIIAAREAGMTETADSLLAEGRDGGLIMGGWMIGAEMLRGLEQAEPAIVQAQTDIAQAAPGGAGLWLRAEPGENAAQADALAAIIASGPDQAL